MQRNKLANFLPYLVVILAVISLLGLNMGASSERITYYELQNVIEKEKVDEVSVSIGTNVTVVKGVYEKDKQKVTFTATIPSTSDQIGQVIKNLGNESTKLTIVDADASNIFLETVVSIIPFILFAVFAVWMLNRMNGANGANAKAFEFSKSRAKLEGKIRVRFSDVAGCDEEKQEMAEIIDYLKYPKKFEKMGARIPKGILLSGHPGTGKTLLAKAVAGEANVPFYSISGSDFVEMFVGVGASRVRDMFKKAQQTAPCIIFIDEIDAVGRQRGAGFGGGHDEREQTLNQLLVEMDGMEENTGVVVIAATNRPDVLDPALLRAGRFDRQITVALPDRKGREAILHVHARNKKFVKDLDLGALAKRTPGFSGADLENVLNEAAILAVRENKDEIGMKQIDEAIDRVMMGPAKVSRTYDDKTKKLVAYHESGHAIIGLFLENAQVVQKVTIIPRGQAGGYNLMTPKEEKMMHTKNDLLDTITSYMGGRTAEELFFDDITTGASNDIQNATNIAKDMVTLYGMSDLGPIKYNAGNENVFLGRDYNQPNNVSGEVAYEIDQEVRKIINTCHTKARQIIEAHKTELETIAHALMEYETLTAEQIQRVVKGEDISADFKYAEKEPLEPTSEETISE
ncbi:ATP-dependent zinc metalloprotease FtsH [Solobacterium sp.]|uniref:ATP-dependent zinc metalloprotease FtsH n=1 Tax=Solobacterium sp. TaxID=2060878 RepID=UPI001CABB0EB|nr:ATP-dependent zinc metalloprotease FtsH [Solobacterium sp.]MBF1090773.1 ATP-dependent metallopeptidase FtsH/Yme1/Tma family protein [Solobacterium sp.]MBF1098838.1 ATP-dependent metallopeptidase FtsH/Yme1/Tma family protein [Solobacterium sp.]